MSQIFHQMEFWSSENAFCDLLKVISKFTDAVYKTATSVERKLDGSKEWRETKIPNQAEYKVDRAHRDYEEAFPVLRRRLRIEFGRFAEPSHELELLLSMLEFRDFPRGILTAQDLFDAELYLEKETEKAYDLWDKLAARLEGLLDGVRCNYLDIDNAPRRVYVPPRYLPYRGVYVDQDFYPLSLSEWKLMKLMSDCRREGRQPNKPDLEKVVPGAVKYLQRLIGKKKGNPSGDKPWNEVIVMAGKRGGGYSIR